MYIICIHMGRERERRERNNFVVCMRVCEKTRVIYGWTRLTTAKHIEIRTLS